MPATRIRVGTENTHNNGDVYPILKAIPHPRYNVSDPFQWDDIGLIKTSRIVMKRTAHNFVVNSICLPVKNSQPLMEEDTVLSGWGFLQPENLWPKDLRQLKLSLIDNRACRYMYQIMSDLKVPDTVICAGDDTQRMACQVSSS